MMHHTFCKKYPFLHINISIFTYVPAWIVLYTYFGGIKSELTTCAFINFWIFIHCLLRFKITALCSCFLNKVRGKYTYAVLYTYLYSYLYCCSLFLRVNSDYSLLFFLSAWRNPFSVSCKSGLLVMNSLSLLIWESLNFCFICEKNTVAGYRILGWQSFFLHFEYVTPLLSDMHGFWWENSY